MAKQPAKRALPKNKAPPRKKVTTPRRRGKAFAESEKAKLTLPQDTTAAVKYRAGMAYITDPQLRSVEWWWVNHYKEACPVFTFQKWAGAGNWVARRELHRDAVTAAVMRETAGDHARKRTAELAKLEVAFEGSLQSLTGVDVHGDPLPIPPPKSFGELVAATTRLHKTVEDTRDKLEAGFPMALVNGPGTADEVGVDFSPEQLLAMSHAAIRVSHELPPANSDAPDVGTGEESE